jgi:uncharacterized protein (TIGR02118 family)
MSTTLFALYNYPKDSAEFDRHYEEIHSRLGLGLPGLRNFTGTHPTAGADGGPAPFYFVASLTFDDAEALDHALSSAEGKAVVADLVNFAGEGVTLLNGPTSTYS